MGCVNKNAQSEALNKGSTLLTVSPASNPQLVSSRNRRRTRMAARLLAFHLDDQLARGLSPESSRLLAARAQELVAPAMRGEVAQLWGRLMAEASKPPAMRSARRLLNRAAISACADGIENVREGLVGARPISARSVAMALTLLGDGTGPVYSRRSAGRLSTSIEAVIDELEPRSSWESDYGAVVR